MRLFILSLLAIGSANSHAIGGISPAYTYRTGLYSYSPARGEFPVQEGLGQGYVRYIDHTGNQRLLAYNYPEPLYGVRRLGVDKTETVNPFLRTSSPTTYGVIGAEELNQRYKWQENLLKDAQFRAWCEQRYQELKTEMEQLRAQGKLPPTELLAQLSPLQQLLNGSKYEAVTYVAESPEIQRAREEHLRIWNEARLKVLQLEAEQTRLQGKGEEIKPIAVETPAFANRIDAEQTPIAKSEIKFSPAGEVLETPEVMRAREEHFRLFNEAKLRAEKAAEEVVAAPLVKSVAGFDAPAPIQDTPEVIRAREEHLKLKAQLEAGAAIAQPILGVRATIEDDGSYKPAAVEPTAVLRMVPAVQQPVPTFESTPITETPEVVRAREEHLRLVNEAKLLATQQQQQQQQQQIIAETPIVKTASDDDAERLREAERIREETRLLEAERLREADRLREEEKLREAERLLEIERFKEEERLMEAERLRLKKEEDERMAVERLAEAKQLQEDKLNSDIQTLTSSVNAENQPIVLPFAPQVIVKYQPKDQPTVLPSTRQSPSISYVQPAFPVTTSVIAENQPTVLPSTIYQYKENPFFVRFAGEKPSYLINARPLAANAAPYYLPANALKQSNPFFVRYTQEAQPESQKDRIDAIAPTPVLKTEDLKTVTGEQIITFPVSSFAPLSPSMKINYGDEAALTELEKATREHFRAHEIALEQLRLANFKDPNYKDC